MTAAESTPPPVPPGAPDPAPKRGMSTDQKTILVLLLVMVVGLPIFGLVQGARSGVREAPKPDPEVVRAENQRLVAEFIRWRDAGGLKHIFAVQAATAPIGSPALSSADRRAQCVRLQQVTGEAMAFAPIPDREAQIQWSTALDRSQQAATQCVKAIDGNDMAAWGRVSPLGMLAYESTKRATDRIRAINEGAGN